MVSLGTFLANPTTAEIGPLQQKVKGELRWLYFMLAQKHIEEGPAQISSFDISMIEWSYVYPPFHESRVRNGTSLVHIESQQRIRQSPPRKVGESVGWSCA